MKQINGVETLASQKKNTTKKELYEDATSVAHNKAKSTTKVEPPKGII